MGLFSAQLGPQFTEDMMPGNAHTHWVLKPSESKISFVYIRADAERRSTIGAC
jgi:hypothetical protein